jgi:hypothetical protein
MKLLCMKGEAKMSSKSKTGRGKKESFQEPGGDRLGDRRPPPEQPTPIVITGGSLTVESQGVEWRDWTDDGAHKKVHPLGARRITRIFVQNDNNPADPPHEVPVPPNGKCTITIVYRNP